MTSATRRPADVETRLAMPYGVLSFSIFAFSFAAIFIKFAQQAGMPSVVIAAGRLLLAGFILSPLVWWRYRDELKQLTRRDLLLAMSAGLFLALDFMLMVTSLEYISVMVALVILNTTPIWVAILEWLVLGARHARGVWIGLVLSLSGGVVIAVAGGTADAGGTGFLIGCGMALASALTASGYFTIARDLRKKVTLFPYVWIVFSCAGIVAVIFVTAMGIPLGGYSGDAYLWLLLLTLIPQLIGHSGVNFALGYIPATVVAISNQSVTVTASIAAFFVFGEVPMLLELVGSVVIICGVILTLLAPQQKRMTDTG